MTIRCRYSPVLAVMAATLLAGTAHAQKGKGGSGGMGGNSASTVTPPNSNPYNNVAFTDLWDSSSADASERQRVNNQRAAANYYYLVKQSHELEKLAQDLAAAVRAPATAESKERAETKAAKVAKLSQELDLTARGN